MRFLLLTAAMLSVAACHQAAQQQPSANESAAGQAAGEGLKGVHRDHKGTRLLDERKPPKRAKPVPVKGRKPAKRVTRNKPGH